MKKKVLTLCLVVALAATAIIGGTLAYFTDTDSETNVFTIGNIKIDIEEVFPDKELMPGEWNKNNLQKEVTVKNTGANDAYMWIEVLVPAALDNVGDASKNSLHFNPYDTYKDGEGKLHAVKGSVAKENGWTLVATTAEVYMGETKIDDVTYHRYLEYIVGDTAKKSGESTYDLLAQVYMDKAVTNCTNHESCYILKDGTTHYTGSWQLIINAYGIQAEGFSSIAEAINAYYNASVIK